MPKIITIGLSPAWDIIYNCPNLDYNSTCNIYKLAESPAGKSLNVSSALAWMGQATIASGLWGNDFGDMQSAISSAMISTQIVTVDRPTRRNMTLIDSDQKRELHLVQQTDLADRVNLSKLKTLLEPIIDSNSICIFSGQLPHEFIVEIMELIDLCKDKSAKIVLDSYGPAFQEIISAGGLWLISPNIAEFSQLAGIRSNSSAETICQSAQHFLDRVEIVLVSRGDKGAIAASKTDSYTGKFVNRQSNVFSTTGCGDYFLAGFVKSFLATSKLSFALEIGIKAATAKAWNWHNQMSWPGAGKQIKVKITPITL